MSRAQQSPRHVYDDELDQWFEFDTQQEIDDFIDQASTHSSDMILESRAPTNLITVTLF